MKRPFRERTNELIRKTTQDLIQKEGLSQLSIDRIAKRCYLGKSGILYHFPSKDILLQKTLENYRKELINQLETNSQEQEKLTDKLKTFLIIYQTFLEQNKICLCTAVSCDFPSLPKIVQEEIISYTLEIKNWLIKTIRTSQEHLEQEENTHEKEIINKVEILIYSLQGLMIGYRIENNSNDFLTKAEILINKIILS